MNDEQLIHVFGAGTERTLAIQSNLAVLKCLQVQILQLDKAVLARAKVRPEYEKLLTVDGIDARLLMGDPGARV